MDLTLFFCKHCNTNFHSKVPEQGDFFFVCPVCEWKHYRHVEDGAPVHCNIKARKNMPMEIEAKRYMRWCNAFHP